MKSIGIAAVNTRIKSIATQFGTDSEVYRRATHYIEANVADKYLKKDKVTGEVIGIRQTKEALKEAKLYMRPEALNEYVPQVRDLFVSEKAALVEEIQNRSKTFTGPDLDPSAVKNMSYKTIMADPNLSRYFTNRIESLYADLNDQKSIILQVYDVRDNKQELNDADYNAGNFHSDALDLVDELHAGLGRNRDWMRRARALIQRYEDACNEQIREEIRKARK